MGLASIALLALTDVLQAFFAGQGGFYESVGVVVVVVVAVGLTSALIG